MANFLLMVFAGLAAGLLSGLLGVGGGVILVPIFVYVFKMDIHSAIGTSLAVIVPTAFMGALKHYKEGAFDFRLCLWVAVFSILGAWLGAYISLGTAAPILKKGFALFLFVLSIYMFFKG